MERSHGHKPGVLVRSQDDVSGAGKASSFRRCIEIAICEIRVCSKSAGNSFVHLKFTHADLSPRIYKNRIIKARQGADALQVISME